MKPPARSALRLDPIALRDHQTLGCALPLPL